MIDTMAESIFESMLPLTIEHLSTSPPINCPLTDDDDLLSTDYWKKFGMDFPELSDMMSISIDDIFNELDPECANSWSPATRNENADKVFLNHDCMWAGHCGSKEHAEEPRLSCLIPKPPIIKKEMCPPPAPPMAPRQQSLLKPSIKATNNYANFTLPNFLAQQTIQTPPESDDEEKAATTNLMNILAEAISECDSDLTDYFEGKEEPRDEPMIKEHGFEVKEEAEDTESEREEVEHMTYEEYKTRTQMAAENDHSYYKDKNAAMRNNNYGLETPSDSEEDEEIDVVSVPDKFSLPTNPSNRVRQQLQKRMATAMSKKRAANGGIKTILPVRNADAPLCSKNAAANRRGIKRGRVGRNNYNCKRKRPNAQVECEPADKRHMHNNMERQRRVGLRVAFDYLKSLVPDLASCKKSAKVHILLQSAQYCYYLTGANINYTKQLEDLRKKQAYLRSRVSQLRRSLAARR